MDLLSLPTELIHYMLNFADWQDVLSFISTTEFITDHILSKSDISRIRHNCRDRLLAWETERRTERGWPLELNVIKGAWYAQVLRYGDHMYLGHESVDKKLAKIPCYTCFRFRKFDMFTSSMRCGGRMIGQTLASRRICIPCGVKTGFYYGGEKMRASLSVCEKCANIMSPWSGMRNDPDTLQELSHTLPKEYDVSAHDDYGRSPRIELEEFWWWTYSHMCAICVAAAGYTMEHVLNEEPRKDMLRLRMKERYKRSMLASLEKRQEKGRKLRATLGIAEPRNLLDIKHMKLKDDPFPGFRPVAINSNFGDGEMSREEFNAAILSHMNGETSAAQIQKEQGRRRNASALGDSMLSSKRSRAT